jgi:hypothetical protein
LNYRSIRGGPETTGGWWNAQAIFHQRTLFPWLINILPTRNALVIEASVFKMLRLRCSESALDLAVERILRRSNMQVTQLRQLIAIDVMVEMVITDIVIVAGAQRAP